MSTESNQEDIPKITDHQLVLNHISNNHKAVLELASIMHNHLPLARESIDWVMGEHLRVNKEIQAEYMAARLSDNGEL